jgi:hypothetical protein
MNPSILIFSHLNNGQGFFKKNPTNKIIAQQKMSLFFSRNCDFLGKVYATDIKIGTDWIDFRKHVQRFYRDGGAHQ